MIARLPGVSSAAPMPCSPRASTSTSIVGAAAHITEATREPRDADDVHLAATEPVAQRSADEDQRGERERVGVERSTAAQAGSGVEVAVIAGSARLTIEPSRNAMPEPRIIAASSHLPCALASLIGAPKSRTLLFQSTSAIHSSPRSSRCKCLHLVSVRVRDVREVGSEQDPVLQIDEPRRDLRGL